MPRYCFTHQVRPDRIAEYVERHRTVWPDMVAALADTGWRNYSLFLREDGLLVGYVESDDLEESLAAMARTEINTRWQAEMSSFFVAADGSDATAGQAPDEGFTLIPQVFHLGDQLTTTESRT